MNKSELLALMHDPSRLTKHQVGTLRSIATDFPYYQGVQVLISKALANEKHYLLDGQLKKTALTIPDRNVLYEYMHDLRTVDSPQSTVHGPVSDEVLVPDANYPEKEQESMLNLDELAVKLPEPEPEPIAAPEVLEIPVIDEVVTPAVENPVEPLLPLISEDLTPFPVDEIAEGPPVLVEDPDQPEIPIIIEVPLNKEPLPVSHANEIHSFTEWLMLAGGKEIKRSPEIEASEPAEVKPPENKEIAAPEPNAKSETEKPAKPVAQTNLKQFETILDKFIRENPGISRPKGEFFNPHNIARQSVEEDENLVTETLANIYRKQGHYKKAIRAYEKLCLVYPHKMAYFADLIHQIKQEPKD